jgi:ABC-type sugar transport system ATPase subunit
MSVTAAKSIWTASKETSSTILTQDAQKIGIATVYQEVNLCPNLSVAENLFIGREPKTKMGTIDWKEMNRKAMEADGRAFRSSWM